MHLQKSLLLLRIKRSVFTRNLHFSPNASKFVDNEEAFIAALGLPGRLAQRTTFDRLFCAVFGRTFGFGNAVFGRQKRRQWKRQTSLGWTSEGFFKRGREKVCERARVRFSRLGRQKKNLETCRGGTQTMGIHKSVIDIIIIFFYFYYGEI